MEGSVEVGMADMAMIDAGTLFVWLVALVVCTFLGVLFYKAFLVKVPTTVLPPKEEGPKEPADGEKAVVAKKVDISERQRKLMKEIFEEGIGSRRIKRTISRKDANALYRAIGYAFDIPCFITTNSNLNKMKKGIVARVNQMRKVVPKIPGPGPKQDIPKYSKPVTKEAPTAPAAKNETQMAF